ncbi:hypothetical protein SAMN02746065_10923 [Desulfocicer vacuolatum DSM 3385]|uniref:Uncharacterized protein n=1 Tax=Desulfocicer vacuolatum DSM 3385 TaxID=1121400 RepID=A0A1W2BQ70_9BACT|nr:hypothetical protein SAMN02746065_10923 [Desulfocicer vacuolatum DSM 3385]
MNTQYAINYIVLNRVSHGLLVGQVGHGWVTAMMTHQKETLKQWLIKTARWVIHSMQ